jgi:GAF domain-containing protein
MNREATVKSSDSETTSLIRQARALLTEHSDRVANAANLSALVFMNLKSVNWAGFYFLQQNTLVLGPFQGKPACVSIPMGQGVCGTAALTRSVQRVADVHDFEGHIACDINSRSELVVPLVRSGELIGVFDLDSPVPGRFSENDEKLVVELSNIYLDSID